MPKKESPVEEKKEVAPVNPRFVPQSPEGALRAGDHVIYVGQDYHGDAQAFNAVVVKVLPGGKANLIYAADAPHAFDEHGQKVMRADTISPKGQYEGNFYYKP